MNQPTKPEYSDAEFLRDKFLIPVCMLIAAISVIPLSYLGYFKPESEPAAGWFLRGGAFVTIFSLMADSVLIKTFEYLNPRGLTSTRISELRQRYRGWLNFTTGISLLVTIIGSIIWGYGDILYLEFH